MRRVKGRGVNGGHQVRYVYVLVLVVEEKDASEALIRMMRVAIADDGPLLGIFLPGPSRYIKGMTDGSLHEGRYWKPSVALDRLYVAKNISFYTSAFQPATIAL